MDYSNKMDVILKAVGVRTMEEAIDSDAQLRKSRSDVLKGRKASLSHKRLLQKSKSDGDIRSVNIIPPPVISPVPRDRSQSLDSVLSRSSTSSFCTLNPSGFKTPDNRLSPLFFKKQNVLTSFSSEHNDTSETTLVVPSNWEWNAWGDTK